MEEGQIVVAPIQQEDGKVKDRPILLLKKLPYENDWLVCGISSKLFREIHGFDIVIDASHPDFKNTRLPFAGLIRLSFLSSISEKRIKGILGKISVNTHRKLINNLRGILKKT